MDTVGFGEMNPGYEYIYHDYILIDRFYMGFHAVSAIFQLYIMAAVVLTVYVGNWAIITTINITLKCNQFTRQALIWSNLNILPSSKKLFNYLNIFLVLYRDWFLGQTIFRKANLSYFINSRQNIYMKTENILTFRYSLSCSDKKDCHWYFIPISCRDDSISLIDVDFTSCQYWTAEIISFKDSLLFPIKHSLLQNPWKTIFCTQGSCYQIWISLTGFR